MPDREKLIELIQSAVGGCATYWAGLIADALIANGATIPVRCTNCKNFGRNHENDTFCRFVGGLSDPEDNDFCSYGERKTDGESV